MYGVAGKSGDTLLYIDAMSREFFRLKESSFPDRPRMPCISGPKSMQLCINALLFPMAHTQVP